MKKKILPLVILFFVFKPIYSQSAQIVTEILNSKQVTFGQVCYLSAVYQNLIKETDNYSKAIQKLYEKKQIPAPLYEKTYVPMVNLAYIYSKMMNIKGGLFFNLFNGAPRYAYKQLKSDGILPQNSDPSFLVSGQQALDIFTSCSIYYNKEIPSIENENQNETDEEFNEENDYEN